MKQDWNTILTMSVCDRCHRAMDIERMIFLDTKIRMLNFDKSVPSTICLCHDCYDKFKDFMEELGRCKLFDEKETKI